MHHLSAYASSIANGASNAQINAIADQCFASRNNRYQFPMDRRLIQAAAFVPDGTSVKLDYPSAFQVSQPDIDPIDGDAVGGSLPPVYVPGQRGLVIPRTEDVGVVCSRAGAGATACYALLWTTSQWRAAPPGDIISVRATAAATGAADAWQLAAITLDSSLPAGNYAVIGARVTGANVLAARFVFVGQVERPGVLANVAPTGNVFQDQRYGRSGLFGVFQNLQPPQIECLGFGAVAAQVITLDLIRLGMS